MPDASRSVSVAQSLLSDSADQYKAELAADYERVRDQHANKKAQVLWPLDKARANAAQVDFEHYRPKTPQFLGKRHLRHLSVKEIAQYIDWTPFFQTWDLAGKYPAILQDEVVGEAAAKVFADGQAMLDRLIAEQSLSVHAAVGLYPAQRVGADDIVFYADESRQQSVLTWHGLRQQSEKTEVNGQLRPSRCLADFVADQLQAADYAGAFAVTVLGADERAAKYEAAHDDYNAIMVKALADRLAEAAAEYLHSRVRTEWWGYAPDERLDSEALIREEYQGIRPAPGYPACPDHSAKKALFGLIDAPGIGMGLTDSMAMTPASSVSGFYLAHPEATYFNVGKIGEDQVQDLAQRSGLTEAALRRLLGPNL